MERRFALRVLLGTDEQSRIQFSDEFDGEGAAFFNACAERGLEGIVSKHACAVSIWSQQNLAEDQVLHPIKLRGDRYRP